MAIGTSESGPRDLGGEPTGIRRRADVAVTDRTGIANRNARKQFKSAAIADLTFGDIGRPQGVRALAAVLKMNDDRRFLLAAADADVIAFTARAGRRREGRQDLAAVATCRPIRRRRGCLTHASPMAADRQRAECRRQIDQRRSRRGFRIAAIRPRPHATRIDRQ